MDLELMSSRLAVVRLSPDAPVPSWASGPGFVSITRTDDELSIVCPEDRVPTAVTAEGDFRGLKVRGPLPFAEVGVLESIARPLADAAVSIFAISTYDTDYVLLRDGDLDVASRALVNAGHSVRP